MKVLGDRLDALATAAVGDFHPPPPGDIEAKGRRRRVRRRILAATSSLSAIAVVVAIAVAISQTNSTVRVTTSLPPVPDSTSAPPLLAIASASAHAASAVTGPPEALGEVVGTTTSAAQALLNTSTSPLAGLGQGTVPGRSPTTTPGTVANVAAWWVIITRHHVCPPGCANFAELATDYVSVLLRASDLRVLQVRSLGSENPNLALVGPVYPLVLPGQALPSRQPSVAATVVPAATVEAADLKGEGCAIPAHLSGLRDDLPAGSGPTRCTSVAVRLYPNWAALSDSVPGVVEPGLAFSQPSRPIYYVTTWGRLRFSFKGLQPRPAYVDHDNGIYDAVTGEGEGGGTAGEPLP